MKKKGNPKIREEVEEEEKKDEIKMDDQLDEEDDPIARIINQNKKNSP